MLPKTNSKIKDRMMLIIRIECDGMDIREAARSLGKSDPWGYKWYARYKQVGFYDLDDQVRTGRPPKVDKAIMRKIRKECLQEAHLDGQGDAGLYL